MSAEVIFPTKGTKLVAELFAAELATALIAPFESSSVLNRDAVLADFVLSSWPGSEPQTVGAASPVFLNGDGLWQFNLSTFVFTLTEDITPSPANVVGWLIMDAAEENLLAFAIYDPMRQVALEDDTVDAQPGVTVFSKNPV